MTFESSLSWHSVLCYHLVRLNGLEPSFKCVEFNRYLYSRLSLKCLFSYFWLWFTVFTIFLCDLLILPPYLPITSFFHTLTCLLWTGLMVSSRKATAVTLISLGSILYAVARIHLLFSLPLYKFHHIIALIRTFRWLLCLYHVRRNTLLEGSHMWFGTCLTPWPELEPSARIIRCIAPAVAFQCPGEAKLTHPVCLGMSVPSVWKVLLYAVALPLQLYLCQITCRGILSKVDPSYSQT